MKHGHVLTRWDLRNCCGDSWVLLCIGFKDTLLIGNGIALALQLVLMGKSWVKGGNWLLDVYKRQSQEKSFLSDLESIGKGGSSFTRLAYVPGSLAGRSRTKSVSYTHLDVYKRQALKCLSALKYQ